MGPKMVVQHWNTNRRFSFGGRTPSPVTNLIQKVMMELLGQQDQVYQLQIMSQVKPGTSTGSRCRNEMMVQEHLMQQKNLQEKQQLLT